MATYLIFLSDAPNLGLRPHFTSNDPTVVDRQIVRHSQSGSYTVYGEDGTQLARCRSAGFWRPSKKLYDTSKHLFMRLRRKRFSLRDTFIGEDEFGKEVLRVTKHLINRDKMSCSFVNQATNQPEVVTLRVSKYDDIAILQLGTHSQETKIVWFERKLQSSQDRARRQVPYAMRMCARVDVALTTAIFICFDEAYNGRDRR